MHYQTNIAILRNKWDKVFKNESSKIWGRQSLKNLKGYGLLQACYAPSNVLKAWFHKFYLVHSWILVPNLFSKQRQNRFPKNEQTISHGQDEHSTEFSEQEIFYFSGSVLEKRSLKKKQKKFHIKTYGKSTWTL